MMQDDLENPQSVLRPSGTIIVDDRAVADTVQCVHCGGHFVMVKGSGKTRGWCFKCNGMICGPSCRECLPKEKWLDMKEKGLLL